MLRSCLLQCMSPFVALADVGRYVSIALRDRKKIRILAIGATSIARRDSAPGGYHSIIEQFLERTFKGVDVEIFNRGVSGELARDPADRIRTEVALTEADLVLWQVGTADALARMPVDGPEVAAFSGLRMILRQ